MTNEYKMLSDEQLIGASTFLAQNENEHISMLGKEMLSSIQNNTDMKSVLAATVVIIATQPQGISDILYTVISYILYKATVTPYESFNEILTNHLDFCNMRIDTDNIDTSIYLSAIQDIVYGGVNIIQEDDKTYTLNVVSESVVNWSAVLEAPEDEATDYTDEVDDGPEEDPDTYDEPTDYTDDVDDDTNDTEGDAGDTDDEATDYTDEVDSDDTDTDVETSDDPEDTDIGDEPTDYTDEVDSEDDTDAEDDTTDDSYEDTDTDSTDDDNEYDKNNKVKNYNLLVDFQRLLSTVGEILDNMGDVVYPQTIQNQVLSKGLNNLRRIKDQIIQFIEFGFSDDYKANVYYYTIYLQAMKLNLELLKKNVILQNK